MTTYRADVTREDGWWMIRVPELDLITQAENWGEVERMARGVIIAALDLEPADVRVDLTPLPAPEVSAMLSESADLAARAEALQGAALFAKQQAARTLHAEGWSYRLIGKAMRLSHQRAEQLVKGRR